MRVGELMISNGAPAAEVTATMLRITASSGIRNVSVQVTLTEVSVSYLPDSESTPFTRIRAASSYTLDYAKLDAVERIATRYAQGSLELQDARQEVEKLWSKGRHYGVWTTYAGWAVMGAACALFFGGGPLVVVFAALAAGMLAGLLDLLGGWRLPEFYNNVVGGMFSVVMAMIVHAIDPTVNSSLVVVACIILILAGLTSVGAMQDAITGWYVTAAARLLQTFMLTIAAIIGVRAGILAADAMGMVISVSPYLPTTLISTIVSAVGGAGIGLGYSIGVQLPGRLMPWTTLMACGTSLLAFLLENGGMGRAWAVGLAAAAAGFASVLVARRVQTPAMILAAASVITMVPGSVIYRGLLGLGESAGNGFDLLFLAAEIAIAISTGVILGQFLAARVVEALPARPLPGLGAMPVFTGPFSTSKRRRILSLGRTNRKAVALTTAIPVVHLDPGELDPTIDWSEGPAWREDVDNVLPASYESGFEVDREALQSTDTSEMRRVEGTREASTGEERLL